MRWERTTAHENRSFHAFRVYQAIFRGIPLNVRMHPETLRLVNRTATRFGQFPPLLLVAPICTVFSERWCEITGFRRNHMVELLHTFVWTTMDFRERSPFRDTICSYNAESLWYARATMYPFNPGENLRKRWDERVFETLISGTSIEDSENIR